MLMLCKLAIHAIIAFGSQMGNSLYDSNQWLQTWNISLKRSTASVFSCIFYKRKWTFFLHLTTKANICHLLILLHYVPNLLHIFKTLSNCQHFCIHRQEKHLSLLIGEVFNNKSEQNSKKKLSLIINWDLKYDGALRNADNTSGTNNRFCTNR